jgi:hypothetical protein
VTEPLSLQSSVVPAEYRSLHKYLNNRFADTVVLTFEQIEALLGFALPDFARRRVDWWAGAAEGGVLSNQASAWTHACRVATPNLLAQSVMFERQGGA